LEETALNSFFTYEDEEGRLHNVWLLDAVSSFNQINASLRMGEPYGFSVWRLGAEDPSVWKILENLNEEKEEVVASLKKFDYGYALNYSGQGGILQVIGAPSQGLRQIEYDSQSETIVKAKMVEYPSSFDIHRWGGTEEKKVVLTFDDGPNRAYTPQVLKILEKYDIQATFFVVGVNANVNQDLVRRIMKEGHTIGNHTYTHPNITNISDSQFTLELDMTQRILEALTGRSSLLFRPPYLEDVEPNTPEQVAPLVKTNEDGYYTVGMQIDSRDWKRGGVDQIVSNVLSGVERGDGNVILMHDGGGNREQTVLALPRIIEGLEARGYEIVDLPELVGKTRDDFMPQIALQDQVFAKANLVSIFSISGFSNFMRAMFFFGIALGIARFFFIVTLSLTQWLRSRKRKKKVRSRKSFSEEVTVLVPAYNEEKVIEKTIRSILRSDYPNFEVVVVDDGSSDRTVEIVREKFAGDERVRIFPMGVNGGKSAALNFALGNIENEIVVTLDADTIFAKNTISKLVQRLVDGNVAAVAGNAKVGNRVNILTRWQALEYITSQNLDKRAFEVLNCITVVPGAVGVWRKSAIFEAGGFSHATLAEDTDLTFGILRQGHRVSYAEDAIAYTEAPQSVVNFVKQRFRWMFGTLQAVWKHKDMLFRKKYGTVGFFSIPNVIVFQIFFPLVSFLMDVMIFAALGWAIWQNHFYPSDLATLWSLSNLFHFYLFFLAIDFVTAIIPFFFEPEEDWGLLIWLPFQRFFYRQLMYFVAIRTILTAIGGTLVGWGKFERTDTVDGLQKA
jgi:peptidoglycan-N-acetylglucosamine deacetylase